MQSQWRTLSSSRTINGDDSILPVLIVGAGPVGLTLSALLTKLGVKCAVLEKSGSFSKHPQAHFINNRSMEVFRKLDGLAEEIQRSQPPVDFWRKFIYYYDRVVSPVSVVHFSQYKLTRLLLKHLESLGFHVQCGEGLESLSGSKILMGHECISIDTRANSVNVTASFLKEGKYMKKDIQCGILVGTDGAGSTVRRLVGINMRGERNLQNLVSVHFLSQELGQYLMNERPGMLFFIFNTDAIGVLVAHDLDQGEFVLQMPFYPPQQKFEDFSSEVSVLAGVLFSCEILLEMCERLIYKLVGRNLADMDVIDIKPWVMHAEVVEKYVSCDSRVILAGDAAHRFPPAGGFGMNTGIQDVHNLAWKLASVVNGIAPPSILSTYEMERMPIANFNTALSLENFRAAMAVPAALGLDPTIANTVHQVINNTVGSILPSKVQRSILDGLFAIGRAQLSDFILNKNNPLGSSRLAEVRRIFEEGKSLQLQFPAEDLGFRYLRGAVVPDSDRMEEPNAPTGRRRDYVPSADPGSRLPHMCIRELSKPHSETFLKERCSFRIVGGILTQMFLQEMVSTLDLVSGDKVEFLLIIAPVESSYRLAQAAFEVAQDFNASMKVCVMWPDGTVDAVARSKAALTPWDNYIDVVEVRQSATLKSWWDLCQMTHRGAILVRPDEHIAWRVKSRVVDDFASEMKKVFSTALGFDSI
ncbi:hypothetical protein RJ639_008964 [Escallonia herrerae]|uniref:FAD-binding domain-containing protein n=1 Tax=Escallonia herrerae TaxID=1293975 RepID=A0AA89ARN2_9ASTE|nr:hypothetical protein RJ639_008964 [Escallonia herrerae]